MAGGHEIDLVCHRCGADLTPGEGNFYVVRIEAFADPTPPTITDADLTADIDEEIQRAIDELRGLSETEIMDQVYRKMTLHLCGRCYRQWIEDPTG
jgi:hypothetical protein